MTTSIVLGAGMVGVSTALALQERGDDVILIDRKGIGRETSYGNAGAIQTEAVEPTAFPRELSFLFKAAVKRENAINWHLNELSHEWREVLAYWKNSAAGKHAEISRWYGRFTANADQYHAPLAKAADAEHLIRREGYITAFRSTESRDKSLKKADRLKSQWHIPLEELSGEQLSKLEPGLQRPMAGGIWYTDVWTCWSPGGLTNAYGQLFLKRGGSFVYGDALGLKQELKGGYSLHTENGKMDAERVVVALGPWSTQLTERLNYKIPLFRQRGYHRHFDTGEGPIHSMLDHDNAAFMSPMNQGLRICTGAELTNVNAAPDLSQIRKAEKAARELFDFGDRIEKDPWIGNRPCLPDMLPVLGQAPRHKDLWFNFGHAHQGFTGGPATAQMLMELMDGQAPDWASHFSPARYSQLG